MEGFSTFNIHYSAYIILLIAVDRYMKIRAEFTRNNACLKALESKSGLINLLSLCFLWSFVTGGSSIIDKTLDSSLPGICIANINIVGMVTMYVLYIRMYTRVWQHTKIRVNFNEEISLTQFTISLKYTTELGKTILLILISVAIRYLPFIVLHTYTSSLEQAVDPAL